MSERPQVVIVTGMSGAGRSTAAKALEDLGFFVIDNLPPALIGSVVAKSDVTDQPRTRLAVVIDSRTGVSSDELEPEVLWLRREGVETSIVFLDADNQTLLRRFDESRRPHPMDAPSLEESVAAERHAMEDLRGNADLVVDTTDLNVHELRARIVDAFSGERPQRPMQVSLLSFGYKHGAPRDVDLMFDVRFLPNPHWVPELRPLVGTDEPVADYVLTDPVAKEFIRKTEELLEFLIPRYEAEKKAYLVIGVGCTGGRHRSVAIAEELGRRLRDAGTFARVHHRDVEK